MEREKFQHENRYKSNKHGSMDDRRSFRSISKRLEQKASRQKKVANFRAIDESNIFDESISDSTKPVKPTLEELSKKKYQDLLKWREERKRLLEKENLNKKPIFKTGFFKPDLPKYLISKDDLDASKLKTASFSAACKSPRATPCKPVKTAVVAPFVSSQHAKSSLKSTEKKVSRPSFAPENFQFEPPPGVKAYNLSETFQQERVTSKEPEQILDDTKLLLKSEIIGAEPVETLATLDANEQPLSLNTKSEIEKENEEEEKLEEEEAESEEENDFGCSVLAGATPGPKQADGQACLNKTRLKEEFELPVDIPQCVEVAEKLLENVATSLVVEDTSPSLIKPEIDEDVFSEVEEPVGSRILAGATPGPKESGRRRGRRSIAVETPTLSRLRPRTPCSRNTRRSQLAHCDGDCGLPTTPKTPKITKTSRLSRRMTFVATEEVVRKSALKSASKSEHKCVRFDSSVPADNDESSEEDDLASSMLFTDLRKSRVTPVRSSVDRRRRRRAENPFEKFLNDSFPIGSPLLAECEESFKTARAWDSPLCGLDETYLTSKSYTNLDTSRHDDSSFTAERADDSPPCGLDEMYLKAANSTEDVPLQLRLSPERSALSQISLNAPPPNLEFEDDVYVKKSTRVSLGLFAKDSTEIENTNLSSPIAPQVLWKKERKMSRVSLHPGLSPCPERAEESSANVDLMSFCSPGHTPAKRVRKNVLLTPLRRSTRIMEAALTPLTPKR